FYFPLPQDASISGFAMWIGGELVEADVVEKQRAREIFETILRERRDPALLEWAGGNIFKARVFPIVREKRIRITYTQVLPKVRNEYRYHYGLQSDMLRLTPLKQLVIDVRLHSAEPIESVRCPSHPMRIRMTDHSARAEFDAEEYVPKRDFELRVRTKATEKGVTLLSHVRGEDGYFMLLVGAPEKEETRADPARESEPVCALVMADTSGSMAGPQAKTQVRFIEALVASLGEKDLFNLMTCDVDQRWAFERPVAVTGPNLEKALEFLEKRRPLGWSDLDGAFRAVMKEADGRTHVVYVGDGVPTTGTADPAVCGKRIRRMYGGKGNFHAVAPGSAYESAVLRAVASLGNGSMRVIGGGTDPVSAALQLVREITVPSVKNLRVELKGVPVAALYPGDLPNLPAGRQQIVVGRYRPGSGEGSCRVKVSGALEGREVTYGCEAPLGEERTDNSFIPRLWARAHLDHLLAQGRTPVIRDRIIALSEDYNIITPYTSFLVLESDEDRKRFRVTKRLRMRDAEAFFAEGRDRADFELTRKQMLVARRWRKNLRARVLRTLAGLNRHLTLWIARTPDRYGGGYRLRSGAEEAMPPMMGMRESAASRPVFMDAPAEGLDALETEAWEPAGETPDLQGELPETLEESKEESVAFDLNADADLDPGEPLSRAQFAARNLRAFGGNIGVGGGVGGRYGAAAHSSRGVADAIAGKKVQDALFRRNVQYAIRGSFPELPALPPKGEKTAWSADVEALVKSIDRRRIIGGGEGGFRISMSRGRPGRRGRPHGASSHYLVSSRAWVSYF
ncbi:MAG: VIT domain-containing protein, partial [Planctomycetota bacterium]